MSAGLARVRAGVAAIRQPSAASAVVQNFIVRIALIFVTFGTGIIVARTLAPLGRGQQAALGLWPVLLCGFATFGIPMALNYQSRRRPDDARRLYTAAVAIALIAGLVVSALGALLMPLLLHGYDAELIRDARWLMLFAPQILVLYAMRAHLEANGEYTRSILGQLFPTMFTLVGLAALRLANHLTPASAALCYYLPSGILTVWLGLRLWPRMQANLCTLAADATSLLSYGLRSYGTDLINTLSAQLDLAVIVAFLNPVALGLYSVALTLARLLNIVQQSLVTVLFPHASGLDAEQAVELVGRGARFSTAISIVFGIALVTLAPIALPLVYGPAFAAAVPIVPFLAGEAILGGLANVLVQAFLATGRPAIVTGIQAGWLLSAFILLGALVPRMQLTGAAVALLGASIVRVVFVAIAYRTVLHRNVPRLIFDAADIAYVRAKLGRTRASAELATAPS